MHTCRAIKTVLSPWPSAVHASCRTLISCDPVRLWRTSGFSARPAAVHCLCVSCWGADPSRMACHATTSPTTHSSSSPTPRRPSTGMPTARPQFACDSCRTACSSTLTSQRWSLSALLLSSGQLPTSPPSTSPEALCRSHRSSS